MTAAVEWIALFGVVCVRQDDIITCLLFGLVYIPVKKKTSVQRSYLNGTPSGARTLDPLIKSQLLYQLS